MQGAQSNFDVQQYQIMAGRIGDPGVPIAQRLAALDQIPRLWAGVQRFMAEQAARGQTSPTAPAPEINLDEVDAIVGGQ
jgi:hypothetical protein